LTRADTAKLGIVVVSSRLDFPKLTSLTLSSHEHTQQ
jgi:hypothetical protein